MSLPKVWIATLVAPILLLSTTSNSSATSDPATILASTQAQLTYRGNAVLSDTSSISQDFQIKQPTIDFGPNQPIQWEMHITTVSGINADISWNYSYRSIATNFIFSLDPGTDAQSNGADAICYTTPTTYCFGNPANWNLGDPFEVTLSSDTQKGPGWWTATVDDLATNSKLNLGSIKESYPVVSSKVIVTDTIYRSTVTDNCPGDASPVADTYFSPVFDSTSHTDRLPDQLLTTHACTNAAFGTLNGDFIGAYLLYGGATADMQSSPRSDSYSPPSLITSAVPPAPTIPSSFAYSFANTNLSLSVQVPTKIEDGINAVYLVSPQLGYSDSAPLTAILSGTKATFDMPITSSMLHTPINLSFYSASTRFKSDPLAEVITIPDSALVPIIKAHPLPTGSTPAGVPPTNIPVAAKNLKVTFSGNQMTLTARTIQKTGASPTGVLLVAPTFHYTISKPLLGTISGNVVNFTLPLSPGMAGKKIQVSIYLYNKLGTSKALTTIVKLPAKITTS